MTPVLPPFADIYIGLDLGKTNDWTAASVIERSGPPGRHRFDVVGLIRVRGVMFPEVIRRVQTLAANPALRPHRLIPASADGPERLELAPLPLAVVDSTGVGEAVTDDLLVAPLAARVVPVKITGGDTWRRDRWPGSRGVMAYWVAKGLLCSKVQSLLQGGRLKISPALELAATLQDELLNFEVKVTESANETYGCWRSGKHDDMVLSIALACWVADIAEPPGALQAFNNPIAGYRGSGYGTSPRRGRPARGVGPRGR